MKKVGAMLVFISMMICFLKPIEVNATAGNCEIQLRCSEVYTNGIKAGENYELEVYFSKVEAVDEMFFIVQYDSNVFEIIEDKIAGQNGWSETYNIDSEVGMLVEVSGRAGNGDRGKAVLKFGVKALTDAEYANVVLTNIEMAYMGEDIEVPIVSETLVLGKANTVKFYMEDADAIDEVSVPLVIENNVGFNALGIIIKYNREICSFNELVVMDAFEDKVALRSVYEVPGAGEIRAAFISSEDIMRVGEFCVLSFSVNEEAVEGSRCSIEIDVEQITNKAEKRLDGRGTSAIITVVEENEEVEILLGDVNEDESIDLIDAVYVLLEYNGEKALSETQRCAADTDQDGTVSLLDALRIMKYFNGEIRSFENK